MTPPQKQPAAEAAAPRPRGRPPRAVVEQLERTLLDAARHLFVTKGYEMTTMDAVATQARASKRTLYSRFPTKEALFEAVVADHADRSLAPMEARLAAATRDPAPPLREKLLMLGHLFAEQALAPESQALERIISAAPNSFPELASKLGQQGQARANSIVKGLLTEAGAAHPDLAGKAFYSLLVLVPLREQWNAPDAVVPDIEGIVDFVLAGAILDTK